MTAAIATTTSPPASVRAFTAEDGSRVFAVPSRSGSAAAGAKVYHLVRQDGPRLTCTCRAATFGRSCHHTAEVTALLQAETDAKLATLAARTADDEWYAQYLSDNYPVNLGYK